MNFTNQVTWFEISSGKHVPKTETYDYEIASKVIEMVREVFWIDEFRKQYWSERGLFLVQNWLMEQNGKNDVP